MDTQNTRADVCTAALKAPLSELFAGYQARPAHAAINWHGAMRRFGPDVQAAQGLQPQFHGGAGVVVVIRSSRTDLAEIQLTRGEWVQNCTVVCLNPAELREVAARLLDAAHDIETHPAAMLARAQQGGAA